jgi:hypothetical protein
MSPPDYIRQAMQKKYPDADFVPYFAFLSAVPNREYRPRADRHRHHMAPREQFPELDTGMAGPNIKVLTVGEHVQAHRILAKCCPALARSQANPMFIAALGGPVWRNAMNKRNNDPKWHSSMHRLAQDPKWLDMAARSGKKRAYKQLILPETEIVAWYKSGMGLSAIARKVGTGTRPDSSSTPRIARIRAVLERAGVYVKCRF